MTWPRRASPWLALLLSGLLLPNLAKAQELINDRDQFDTSPPQLPANPVISVRQIIPVRPGPGERAVSFDVQLFAAVAPEITVERIKVDLSVTGSDGVTRIATGSLPGSGRTIRLTIPRPKARVVFTNAAVRVESAFSYSVRRAIEATKNRLISQVPNAPQVAYPQGPRI